LLSSLSIADILSAEVSSGVGGSLALVAALALTPLVAKLARRRGWVDRPSDDRWHEQPVALMGGIAIASAIAVGIAIGMFAAGGRATYAVPVWLGAGIVFAGGWVDDRWGMRPDAKVLVQVLATVCILYVGQAFWRGGPVWVSLPCTFLWMICVTNAINLIDGLDGLAASVSVVASCTFFLAGVVLGQPRTMMAAAVLSGAVLGFLPYNLPPARLFMGDCGSLLLGYMLAVIALDVQASGGPIMGTLVPIAVLAVPLFDTTFVTLTRFLRGQSVTSGGTDHVHHRFVHLGLSEWRTVAILTVASAGFGGLALAVLWMSTALALAVTVMALVAVAVVAGYLASKVSPPADETSDPSIAQQVGAFMRTFAGGLHWKSVSGMLADLLLVGAIFVVAIHLRHGGVPPRGWGDLTLQVLPAVIGAKLVVFYAFGLYEGIWRHAGTPEVLRLIGGSVAASVLVGAGLFFLANAGTNLLSVLTIDWVFTTVGIGGARFGFRALRQYLAARSPSRGRAFVFGSGAEAMLLLRHLRHHPELNRSVVGFLDEERDRHGYRVQGIEVLGGLEDLPDLSSEYDVDEVIVPTENTTEADRYRVWKQCIEADLSCRFFDVTLRQGGRAVLEKFLEEERHILSPTAFRQVVDSEVTRLDQSQRPAGVLLLVQVPGKDPRSRDLEEVVEASKRTLHSSSYFSVWDGSLYLFLFPETDEEEVRRTGRRLKKSLKAVFEEPAELDISVEPLHPDLNLDFINGGFGDGGSPPQKESTPDRFADV